jgi:integrase
MGRLNKGVVRQGEDGFWYGRVRWTDEETGKERDKKFPPVKTKTEADKLVEDFKGNLKTHGGKIADSAKVKFEQLAKTYRAKKLFPAKIVNGRKVGGVKSVAPALAALSALENYFGKRRVRSITYSDIETYKLHRLDTPTKYGRQRQISSVNRELELLRAMLRFAIREGWLVRSPFEMGESLISKDDETRRERVLSFDEERRLIAAFSGRRRHVLPLFYAAIDTAARRGELFKLRWRQVDFSLRTITIVAENSKTARPRIIGMTRRVQDELMRLWHESPQDPDGLVFGLTSTIKTAWRSACKEAGITELVWHDLRHTGITRMVQTGRPTPFIQKVSGHTQGKTFSRYVNPTIESLTDIAEALGALSEVKVEQPMNNIGREFIN